MRRRVPWGLIVLGFLAIPILEIYVLIQVGQVIGAWWTIALLILDGILGSWLLRREGSRAWAALRTAIAEGRMPARELADGILVVLGGTLMISPGFVTDVFGVAAILPLTRPLARRLLARTLARRLIPTAGGGFRAEYRQGTWGGPPTDDRPGASGDVIQGDVIDPGEPGRG